MRARKSRTCGRRISRAPRARSASSRSTCPCCGAPAASAGVPVDLVTRNNERVDCLANAIVERSETGDYLRTIVVYTEVGAQARLEQHYRELYRATPGDAAHGRPATAASRTSAIAGSKRSGYRRDEVLGRVITEFMGKETAGDARRRPPRGRHRGGRARERAAHVRDEIRRGARGRGLGDTAIATRAAPSSPCSSRRRTSRRAIERSASCAPRSRRTRGCATSSSASATTCARKCRSSMNFGRIIGESPALKQMLVRVEAVAQTSASVLIEGESGVGKELVAHVIHARSPRSQGPAREGQLRVDSARAVRERVLRPRQRRVHGCASRSRRALPARRRRHDLPRRGRRDPARSAEQAAARAARERVRARRRRSHAHASTCA